MNEIQKKFQGSCESFKRHNPDWFGPSIGASVGPLQGAVREQAPEDALGTETKTKDESSNRVCSSNTRGNLRFRVTLVAYQRILQDSDRVIGGLTDLRDVIADWLLPDVSQRMRDSDKLIQWEYAAIQTRGEEGVAVRIEKL